MRGKEDHEKDTTTVHHDGSGATFGRRDGLGSSRSSDSGEYGSAHPGGNHTPHTPTNRRGHRRQHQGEVLRGDEGEEHQHQHLLPPAGPLHLRAAQLYGVYMPSSTGPSSRHGALQR